MRRFICVAIASLTLLAVPADSAPAGSPVELDDIPQPLEKSAARGEADEDRLAAASLFAAGRMAAQRQDMPGALRRYERAFRLDTTAEPILREIVPLAFTLGREEEAVRYATKLAKLDASDSVLLRRLGIVLTEQGDHQEALALYEKVRDLEAGQPKSQPQVMLRLEMGRLYVLTDQYDKAAEAFSFVSQALDAPQDFGLTPVVLKAISGDKGEIHDLMAVAFLESGQLDEAAKAFARLERLVKNKALAAYNEARLAAKAGRHDEALAKLQVYFDARESSRGIAPYELLSTVLAAKREADEIVPKLEKLLEGQQGNVPLNLALAEEYFKKNEFAKAEPRYKVVLGSQPSGQVYRRLLSIYRHSKDEAKILDLLSELVTKAGSLEAVSKEIEKLAEDMKLVDAVLNAAREKVAATLPADYGKLEAASALALEARSYEPAREFFEAAIKAQPAEKAPSFLRYGLSLFLADKFADAAAVFQRGIDEKLLPDSNPAFHFYLAGALAMDGKTEEALAAARAAAEKKPDDPRFESRIGWVYYHAKRFDDAVKQYRELLTKHDSNYDSPEARSVLHDTRLILSNIAVEQNKLGEAEEWIEQVLDEFPDDVGALNDLGYLWADQNKRLQRACRMIRTAVDAEPENAAYRDSLGWVLYRLGQYKSAAEQQEKALELSKKEGKEPDGVMYDHLGDIYAALDQKDKAVSAWREAAAALEKAGEEDKLQAVKKKL